MEDLYRVDDPEHSAKQMATVSTIAIDATDDLPELTTKHFSLRIRHCRSFHGKGFMPNVKCDLGGMSGNGQVSMGTDQAAYDKALEAGKEMLDKEQVKFDVEMNEIELLNECRLATWGPTKLSVGDVIAAGSLELRVEKIKDEWMMTATVLAVPESLERELTEGKSYGLFRCQISDPDRDVWKVYLSNLDSFDKRHITIHRQGDGTFTLVHSSLWEKPEAVAAEESK